MISTFKQEKEGNRECFRRSVLPNLCTLSCVRGSASEIRSGDYKTPTCFKMELNIFPTPILLRHRNMLHKPETLLRSHYMTATSLLWKKTLHGSRPQYAGPPKSRDIPRPPRSLLFLRKDAFLIHQRFLSIRLPNIRLAMLPLPLPSIQASPTSRISLELCHSMSSSPRCEP